MIAEMRLTKTVEYAIQCVQWQKLRENVNKSKVVFEKSKNEVVNFY